MRSLFALGLLIALCASADAAGVHHSRPRQHVMFDLAKVCRSAHALLSGLDRGADPVLVK